MCDNKNTPHNTGWKVIRVNNWHEKRYAGTWDMYGSSYRVATLYLRCRTDECIGTQLKQIDGHWSLRDFS